MDHSSGRFIALVRLALSVRSAQVKWSKQDQTGARVDLSADITPFTPEADDTIAVCVDGTALFSAPLASFVPAGHLYRLKDALLSVKLNVATGRLDVDHREIDLPTLDNSDGVDIEVQIGPIGAVDNIVMTESHRGLHY